MTSGNLLGREGGTYDFGASSGPKSDRQSIRDLISTKIPKNLTKSRSLGELLCGDDDRALELVAVDDQQPIGHGVAREIVVVWLVLDLCGNLVKNGKITQLGRWTALLG